MCISELSSHASKYDSYSFVGYDTLYFMIICKSCNNSVLTF
jgi:hypothetical protein